jgi:hypothetical protein
VGAAAPATAYTLHRGFHGQSGRDGDHSADDDRARGEDAGAGEGEPYPGGTEGYAADEY